MSNINIELEDDDYYDKFLEESSPRTNYGEGYESEKFSFREMEHIAVNYAITCQKGYTGSFRNYMNGVNKDWRKWLKERDKEESKKNSH